MALLEVLVGLKLKKNLLSVQDMIMHNLACFTKLLQVMPYTLSYALSYLELIIVCFLILGRMEPEEL